MPRRVASGPLLVLAAACLWGTSGTVQALGPEGIAPETVSLIRMVGGALLIGYGLARRTTVPIRTLVGWPLVVAVVAMAGSQPLFFTGVARTGVAVGTIVTIGSGPILAGLFGWLVRGEVPGRRWVVATIIGVIGTVLLTSGGEAAGIDAVGLLFSLGAGVTWAIYLVAAKDLFASEAPVFVAGVVFAGAAIVLSPFLFVAETGWLASGDGILSALWLGGVSTAFSYVLFATGLKATPVAAAATLTLGEPLTAAILGMTVLAEPARATTIVGIALITLGIAALAFDRPSRPREVAST